MKFIKTVIFLRANNLLAKKSPINLILAVLVLMQSAPVLTNILTDGLNGLKKTASNIKNNKKTTLVITFTSLTGISACIAINKYKTNAAKIANPSLLNQLKNLLTVKNCGIFAAGALATGVLFSLINLFSKKTKPTQKPGTSSQDMQEAYEAIKKELQALNDKKAEQEKQMITEKTRLEHEVEATRNIQRELAVQIEQARVNLTQLEATKTEHNTRFEAEKRRLADEIAAKNAELTVAKERIATELREATERHQALILQKEQEKNTAIHDLEVALATKKEELARTTNELETQTSVIKAKNLEEIARLERELETKKKALEQNLKEQEKASVTKLKDLEAKAAIEREKIKEDTKNLVIARKESLERAKKDLDIIQFNLKEKDGELEKTKRELAKLTSMVKAFKHDNEKTLGTINTIIPGIIKDNGLLFDFISNKSNRTFINQLFKEKTDAFEKKLAKIADAQKRLEEQEILTSNKLAQLKKERKELEE